MAQLEIRRDRASETAPATRLRALLQKPNVTILLRSHPCWNDAELPEPASKAAVVRITAMMVADVSHPEGMAEAEPSDDERELIFAKGLELRFGPANQDAVLVDVEELHSALEFFEACARIAGFSPASRRMDQRQLEILHRFREGVVLSLCGEETRPGGGMEPLRAQLAEAARWLEANSLPTLLG